MSFQKRRFLTWLDVQRYLKTKTKYYTQLPEGMTRISCFSSAVEIGIIDQSYQELIHKQLEEWFGEWYVSSEFKIQLDIGDLSLPVEFFYGENPKKDHVIRPFWEEVVYLKTEGNINPQTNIFPQPKRQDNQPQCIAFHSFKGGVGRTLHLTAYILALVARAKQDNTPCNILIIDADLEAPGLTYWEKFETQKSTVSLLQFLECHHYISSEYHNIYNYFSKELKKSVKTEKNVNLYFLPACLNNEELLDTPILPETLVRNPKSSWSYADAIIQLGQSLEVDYIFVDLRAGLSEISSPLVFDSRLQRFLVTTLNQQSIQGISFILNQIRNTAPPENLLDNGYFDPSIIITMLTPEIRALVEFEKATTELIKSYVDYQDEDDVSSENSRTLVDSRLEIKETNFSQELLYINSWDEARNKLQGTSVIKLAQEWADEQLINNQSKDSSLPIEGNVNSLDIVKQLRDTCRKYVYAEEGENTTFLVTESLKNIALNFKDSLPCLISIGSKGSGKTFNYIQIARCTNWENFIDKVLSNNESNYLLSTSVNQSKYVFPFLHSTHIKEPVKKTISDRKNEVYQRLGYNQGSSDFSHSDLLDRITKKLENSANEVEWSQFWINEIADSLHLREDTQQDITLVKLNQELSEKNLFIIFLIDGLEDIFPQVIHDQNSKNALKALIDNLPNKLSELRQPHLGLIIFLRRDFVRHTITQNHAQFENKYHPYALKWDLFSFLKLVFWLCQEAKILDFNRSDINNFSEKEIIDQLEKLWGKRLGGNNSKEAYSHSWIFAVLTDFKNRLQARDIVRFVFNASDITVNKYQEIQFQKWSETRLIPPQAIRRALKPCSEEKVSEAKEEYPIFKEWVDKLSLSSNKDYKKIPFSAKDFDLDSEMIAILNDMGVIYEDTDESSEQRFYMPEIFREGLRFSGQGARPKVMSLKRKIAKTITSL